MPGTLIRVEKQPRKSGGPRIVKIYKCLAENCNKEVKIRNGKYEHSGMCSTHSHQKRPYESIYNCLFNDHRRLDVTLTYEEFLEFTKITNCVYCGCCIIRNKYATTEGEFNSRAYFLDRKNNNKGYSKDNCVVCCIECNQIKRNHLTYDEMIVAMKAVLEHRNRPLMVLKYG